jgi:glycosyltransferase involved in cell wall biosynthesis
VAGPETPDAFRLTCLSIVRTAAHSVTRVVHLISGLMYGGGQKVALDLLDGLQASREIEAELWLLGSRHDMLRERATFVADYSGHYSSLSVLFATARIVRARLAASKIDVVHSHGWDADMIAYLAAFGRPEARVVHLHVTPAWIFAQTAQHRARRLMTSRFLTGKRTRVLAVAHAVRDHWTAAFGKLAAKADVVYNSADPVRFSPGFPDADRDETTFVVGTACRLTPQKGLAVLLRAMAEFVQRSPRRTILRIAGQGPERDGLERLAKELSIAHLVEFLGHVDKTEHFYQTLDAFVLPAVSDEGMPLAIIEAMACGVPVITTNIGGSSEVVRDGVDGYVVAPDSSPALANAVFDLSNNRSGRLGMACNALERARGTFSPSKQLSAVTKVYAELAGTGRLQPQTDASRAG